MLCIFTPENYFGPVWKVESDRVPKELSVLGAVRLLFFLPASSLHSSCSFLLSSSSQAVHSRRMVMVASVSLHPPTGTFALKLESPAEPLTGWIDLFLILIASRIIFFFLNR